MRMKRFHRISNYQYLHKKVVVMFYFGIFLQIILKKAECKISPIHTIIQDASKIDKLILERSSALNI